jgi:GH24 family phage-related lysozyme (muramidase)
MSAITIAGNLIRNHEGFSKFAYQCMAGEWTIDFGRNIDKNGGPGITEEEALFLLSNDLRSIHAAAMQNFPWFSGLNEAGA